MPARRANHERILIQRVHSGILSIDEEGRIWRHFIVGCRKLIPIPIRRVETPATKGYQRISFVHNGKKYSCRAHRLVWQYFHGDIPEHLDINHKDGIKTNNHPSNLELTTPSGNTLHCFRVLGRNHNGENHPSHILFEEQVRWIRDELSSEKSNRGKQTLLARILGVSQAAISQVASGKRWPHVKP